MFGRQTGGAGKRQFTSHHMPNQRRSTRMKSILRPVLSCPPLPVPGGRSSSPIDSGICTFVLEPIWKTGTGDGGGKDGRNVQIWPLLRDRGQRRIGKSLLGFHQPCWDHVVLSCPVHGPPCLKFGSCDELINFVLFFGQREKKKKRQNRLRRSGFECLSCGLFYADGQTQTSCCPRPPRKASKYI